MSLPLLLYNATREKNKKCILMDCWIINKHVNILKSLGITYCSKNLGFYNLINKSKCSLGFCFIVPFLLQITQLPNVFFPTFTKNSISDVKAKCEPKIDCFSKYINKSGCTWMNAIIVLSAFYITFTLPYIYITFKTTLNLSISQAQIKYLFLHRIGL